MSSLEMGNSEAYRTNQKLESTTKNADNLSAGDEIVNTFVINPPLPTVKPYISPYFIPATGGGKNEYEVFYKNMKIKFSANSLDDASRKCFDEISKKLFKKEKINKKVLTVLIRKYNEKRENKFYKFKLVVRKIKSPNMSYQIDIKKIKT